MQYSIKKSTQLTSGEKHELCALFNRVFSKTMTQEDFRWKYEGTAAGYSYHGIMTDNDKIVGCDTSLPFKYRYFDDDVTFALSVDTMIDERYRGNPFNLRKMTDLVYDALKGDHIPFVFGFPNDRVYLVRKRLLKWEDIGELDYYVLPIAMRALGRSLAVLNGISRLVARLVNCYPDSIANLRPADVLSSAVTHGIRKTMDGHFRGYRYGHEGMTTIRIGEDCLSVYKIEHEGNVRVAYIIDVAPLGKRFLESTVQHIYRRERENVDIIMYVGRLPFSPVNLYRVPKRFQPRTVHMAGRILLPEMIDARIFNIDNWAVNLSNFDVR